MIGSVGYGAPIYPNLQVGETTYLRNSWSALFKHLVCVVQIADCCFMSEVKERPVKKQKGVLNMQHRSNLYIVYILSLSEFVQIVL